MPSHGIKDRVAIISMGCTPFGEHWNKSADDLTSPIALQGATPGASAHVYRYSAASLGAIERGDDLALAGGALSASFPASSITLIEVPLS